MPGWSRVDSRYKSFARRQTTLVTPFMLLAVLLVLSAARGPDLFTANGLDGAMIGAAPLVLGTLAITTIAIAGPAGVDLSIGPAMTLINIEIVIELPKVGITGPVAVFACAIGLGIALQVVIGLSDGKNIEITSDGVQDQDQVIVAQRRGAKAPKQES